MPARVVDASVLAAIAFQEPRADEAQTLLRDAELYAPTLLAYELAHVAQKKCQEYPAQRVALERALEAALALDIRWREVDHVAVLRLSLETGLATYDAAYLYLARVLGAPLATFDASLARASQGSG